MLFSVFGKEESKVVVCQTEGVTIDPCWKSNKLGFYHENDIKVASEAKD